MVRKLQAAGAVVVVAIIAVGGWWWYQLLQPVEYVMPAEPIIFSELTAEPEVFASIPYWDQKQAVASMRENIELIDYVSVFWYTLDEDGAIVPYRDAKEDSSIIDFAHDHGVKVLALVANLPDDPGSDWDDERVGRVISSGEARARHISDLIALAERHDFDGINIDYEELKRSQREDFSRFIRDLSLALHERGLLLGVAIHPKTSERNPREANGSQAQDWVAIAAAADHLYFMTYGEHYDDSEPGPVASPSWLANVLAHAAELGVPGNKIFVGLPLYAEGWYADGDSFTSDGDDMVWGEAEALRKKHGAAVTYDAPSQSPTYSVTAAGREHVVWYEDARSLRAKLDVLDQYGLTNIHLWRLGGEDPAIWQQLSRLQRDASD